MIAANRRFDQTRAVIVTASKERESQMAGMRWRTWLGRAGTDRGGGVARDGVPNHLAQFLVIHRG
jgi:hypothetical protein